MNIVSFSGGKDSMAVSLLLKEQGIEYQPVHCDTGWEHKLTEEYIEYANEKVFGGSLKILKSKEVYL